MKNLIFIFLLISHNSGAATKLSLKTTAGNSQFSAIGNPSAIRITGSGEGPEGDLSLREKGDQIFFSGQLKINLNSYDTGIGLRDRHMKEKYLEVGQFGNATLNLNEIPVPKVALSQTGETKMPFSATLDLHGVQKPVQGEFTIVPDGAAVKIYAQFKLKLSDHNIKIPSFAGVTVADHVEVNANSRAEIVK
ncbi:MAG: YceI family protein [Pseudobdellovibrionaceae bacterium]